MSQLEPPSAEQSASEEGGTRFHSLEGTDATVEIPDDATTAEAAAIAAVVGAHLTDRRNAAVAASTTGETADTADEWVLAARMRARGKRHWPRDVERGDEWRGAARSF